MTYEERKARFMSAIKAEANKQSEQINRDTDEYVEKELEKAEEELRRENEADIRSRLSKLRKSAGATVSEEQRAADAELYACRDRIESGVFAAVEAKLARFRAGDGYAGYLISCAENLNAAFGDKHEIDLYYAPEDEKYLPALAGALKMPVSYKADGGIRLGGFRAESAASALAADCTLDAALAEQRRAFRAEAGLCVRA